jgi:chromosome segregation ATPase
VVTTTNCMQCEGLKAEKEELLKAVREYQAPIDAARALEEDVARLTRERDEALDLAYISDHRFPDLTWKARCEEAVADLRSARAALAVAERERDEARAEVARLRDSLSTDGGPREG